VQGKHNDHNFDFLDKNIRIPMKKKKLGGPSLAPQKSRFWADKSRNGPFLPEGFCYSFEISQGLLSNKKIRNPTKIKFQGPPRPPKKADFGRTKAEMGCFSQKGLCYSFEIFRGLLSNKNIRNPMKKIFGESPYTPN